MHAHDLFIDESHQGDVVEAVTESLEETNFIPSLDLIEKAIDPSDSLALVVSSEDNHLLRKSYF